MKMRMAIRDRTTGVQDVLNRNYIYNNDNSKMTSRSPPAALGERALRGGAIASARTSAHTTAVSSLITRSEM